jgi:hypothetical protein
MSANQDRSSSSARRPGSVENEHVTFRRYNYQKPFSAGVDRQQDYRTTDYRKENTRTWLRGGRNISSGKSVSISSEKRLRGLEKI